MYRTICTCTCTCIYIDYTCTVYMHTYCMYVHIVHNINNIVSECKSVLRVFAHCKYNVHVHVHHSCYKHVHDIVVYIRYMYMYM